MNWLASSHQIVGFVTLLVWLSGFAFLALGRRTRNYEWVAISVLGIDFFALTVDLFLINRDLGISQKIWARGWIGPRDLEGAITVGILEDPLGLTFSVLASALGLMLLFHRNSPADDKCPERKSAGILMGVAGVTVAWLSLTPWLSILGTMLAALGGICVLGAKRDPSIVAQFGRDRTSGFILSFLGAAVLAGARNALTMDRGFTLSSQSHVFDFTGGALLATGTYFFLQPIPFSNWLSRPARVSSALSVIVAQVFSALATFAILIRFESELRSTGVLDVFQWVGIASAILSSICGLAQTDWKTALPHWVSAAFSFTFSILCFVGSSSALPILLGAVITASALSLLFHSAESDGSRAKPWFRPLCFAAIAPGLGMIGFVSSGGLVRAFVLSSQDPVKIGTLVLALVGITALAMKSIFSSAQSKTTAPNIGSPVPTLAGVSILLVVSLGLIWTGTFSGGAISHDPDRAFASWISILLNNPNADWWDDANVVLGQSLLWSTLAVSSLLSIWLFGQRQDRVTVGLSRSPRLRQFLETDLAVDRLGLLILKGLKSGSGFLEKWINEKITVQWIPYWTETILGVAARWTDRADRKIYAQEVSTLRRWVDIPAKATQLVQNGDLQWYLVFAIGCVAAMLVHFLRAA